MRLLFLAALLILAGGTGIYARHAVLDTNAFADRAARTLDSDEVRQEAATRLAHRILVERPELWGGEPLLEATLEDRVVGSAAFRAEFRHAALRLHHALFEDRDAVAALQVRGTGSALRAELGPRLAQVHDPPLLTVGSGAPERALRDAAPVAPVLTAFAPAALAVGLVLLVVAALRGAGLWGAGMAVAAAGGLAAAGVTAAGDIVLRQFDTGFGDAVVGAVWSSFLGELRIWGLLAGAAGLVVAAAARGPHPRPAVPAGRGPRVVGALGLLVLAVPAIALPELVLHVALVGLAGALAYVALLELLRPVRSARRPAPLPAGAASPAGSSTSPPR